MRLLPLTVVISIWAIAQVAELPLAEAGKPRWQTLPAPPAMPRAGREGTVRVAGARIYYAVYGKGPPVVLLHGGLGNSGHFGFQLPALIEHELQAIAIDSRGQGRSTRGDVPISYDRMAADVIAVLDELEIDRASVVGWSDGGEVALKLAIHHPERVDRLVVLAANYDARGSKPRTRPMPTFQAYNARCRKEHARLAPRGMSYRAAVQALLPLWRGPTGITRDQLRAIRAPVLMADGDHDEIIELSQIEEMAELIPNAQLEVFRETSHFTMWQDPEGFNAAMLEHLTAGRASK